MIEILNIELPQQRTRATGAGGTFPIYIIRIDEIEVLKGLNAFCEFKNISVSVPTASGTIPYAVLGRDSIFQKFDITFRERTEHILFTRPKRS